MEAEGLDFAPVLKDAQDLGYAEADPTFDIDGIDTAHKTAILAALAFGHAPDITEIPIEGIRNIGMVDINYAKRLGYRVKLLGISRKTATGIETRVCPTMVPEENAISQIVGATNAVVVDGSFVEQTIYVGEGAGEGPTASAVVADIMDVLRRNGGPVFGVGHKSLGKAKPMDPNNHIGTYYVRLRVNDEPGVMADITAALAKEKVSIESLLQIGVAPEGGVYIVMTTHDICETAINASLNHFAELKCVLETPTMLRIETF